MKKKTKKRNPQDATLRNIRALKKRVEKLEEERVCVLCFLHYVTDNYLPPTALNVYKDTFGRIKK